MSGRYQAVLLIAFGGPRSSDEIRPFLARVTKGIPTPPERLEEVARHYQAVGGKSPLNEITLRQAEALQKVLNEQKLPVGVYVGMRNSRPFFVETLKRMADDGVSEALGFILSSHHTEASWERYQQNIADARAEVGGIAPGVDYCPGWHDHPLFIQTWVELIQASLARLSSHQKESAPLVFTAHSVPIAMAARSPYVSQIETTAKLIADKLHRSHWSIAYQSRSGKPTDPWLEPDINQVVYDLAAQGIKEVIVAPIGFVCDHVEVLYDLDIEAKNSAEGAGVSLFRTCSPNDHPTFIQMMADVITGKLREA
jgi:ferrochelatase